MIADQTLNFFQKKGSYRESQRPHFSRKNRARNGAPGTPSVNSPNRKKISGGWATRQLRLSISPLRWGDAGRTKSQISSTFGFLLRPVVAWCRFAGLQIVLSGGRSCLGRIRLRWKTRSNPLLFEEVRLSIPSLAVCDSQNETQSCSEGIQALSAQRPWMSLGDCEAYLQGWFQARQVLLYMRDMEPQSTR